MKSGWRSQPRNFFHVFPFWLENGNHSTYMGCGQSVLILTLVFETCMLTVTCLSITNLACHTQWDLDIRINEFCVIKYFQIPIILRISAREMMCKNEI